VNSCGMSDKKQLKVKIVCRESGEDYSDQFEIFPNPVNDILHLNAPSEENEDCEIILTDYSGRVVFIDPRNLFPGENHFEYDFSNYSNGVYFLSMKSSSQQVIEKIIVQH
jgi:hypothetical protein